MTFLGNLGSIKCKKLECQKSASPGQAYCSKDHAPYASLLDLKGDVTAPKGALQNVRKPLLKIEPSMPPESALNIEPSVLSKKKREVESGLNSQEKTRNTLEGKIMNTIISQNGQKSEPESRITNEIRIGQSLEPRENMNEELSHSTSLVASSIAHLNELMKSLDPKMYKLDPSQINAACNCAKQIASLVRTQVDMVREIRKLKE